MWVATRKAALPCAARMTAAASTVARAATCHPHAVGRRVLAWASGSALLGMGAELALHREPRRKLLQLLGERRCGVGGPGAALLAQMPQRLLPGLARLLHLTRPHRLGPLLALCGAPHSPAFPGW